MRLQVMNLPAPADQFPFVLIVDKCDDDLIPAGSLDGFKQQTGATSVLVFSGEVEVA